MVRREAYLCTCVPVYVVLGTVQEKLQLSLMARVELHTTTTLLKAL